MSSLSTPVIGFNFKTGLSSVTGYASCTVATENGATQGATGITCNATGARYRALGIAAALQPAAWPISVYIRAAVADTSYSVTAGVQRLSGTGTPRDSFAFSISGNTTPGGSVSFRGQMNTTGGASGQNTSNFSTVSRGSTNSDFSVMHDMLVVIDGTSNSSKGRIDSPGTEIASTHSAVTAPFYDTSSSLVVGSTPNDVGNPRIRVEYMGIWDYKLSDADWASLLADPIAAFLTAPPFPSRVIYSVPRTFRGPPRLRNALFPVVGAVNDPVGGSSSASLLESQWFFDRRHR